MDNKRSRIILKHVAYVSLVILFYVLETTPRLFEIEGIKPFMMYGVALAIAINEDQVVAGAYGLLVGIFCDTVGVTLFGYHAIVLVVSAVVLSQMVSTHLMPSLFTYIIFVLVVTMLSLSVQFAFTYGVWRLEAVEHLFLDRVVWVGIYSTVISPLFYFVFKKLSTRFIAN